MAAAFRKIDIDAYDEDVLHESELYDADPRDPVQVLDDAKQRQVAVRSALAKCVCTVFIILQALDQDFPWKCRSDVVGALSIALENAPYGPNVEEAKVSFHHISSSNCEFASLVIPHRL